MVTPEFSGISSQQYRTWYPRSVSRRPGPLVHRISVDEDRSDNHPGLLPVRRRTLTVLRLSDGVRTTPSVPGVCECEYSRSSVLQQRCTPTLFRRTLGRTSES